MKPVSVVASGVEEVEVVAIRACNLWAELPSERSWLSASTDSV